MQILKKQLPMVSKYIQLSINIEPKTKQKHNERVQPSLKAAQFAHKLLVYATFLILFQGKANCRKVFHFPTFRTALLRHNGSIGEPWHVNVTGYVQKKHSLWM